MLADTPLPRGFGAALASVDTFFPRAPEQFVTSPLCLVGYVRWDARSDRVPPLQTIIFSSFPGRTKGCRPPGSWPDRSIQRLLSIQTYGVISWIRRRRIANMPLVVVGLPEQVGDYERAASFQSRNSHSRAVLETGDRVGARGPGKPPGGRTCRLHDGPDARL